MVNKLTAGRTNCRPGKALAATRQYEGMMTDKLPGGAALARTWGGGGLRGAPVGGGMRQAGIREAGRRPGSPGGRFGGL
ncbi:hypothetical protein D4N19_15140, partial [Klebsiella pneumoniae]